MKKTLYLFPDTNLFIQCKPLEELDWSLWGDFDEVRLLVCRPIQAEIDSHKGKGSGRLSKRARAASSIFRKALLADNDYIEVCSKQPLVSLYIRQDLKVDPGLDQQLSYSERDDQLVGIASLFAKANLDADVRILTHDTGPMASAKLAGVAFCEIPDDWLLPPETDESEKRVSALQSELMRYKKAEPSFDVQFANTETNVSALEAEIITYEPLDRSQVAALLEKLKIRFPVATDFGPRVPQERTKSSPFGLFGEGREIFTPASEAEILKYTEEHYPNWVSKCEHIFNNLHTALAARTPWPVFRIRLRNIGARPADDALIVFSARGPFQVCSPKSSSDEPSAEDELTLPPPPWVPRGSWRQARTFPGMENFGTVHARSVGFDVSSLDAILRTPVNKRDPNAFYWKPSRPEAPVQTCSIECKQWRHLVESQEIDLAVHCQLTPGQVSGVLGVEVHASNMTEVFVKREPLHLLVRQGDTFDRALELVNQLIDGVRKLPVEQSRRT